MALVCGLEFGDKEADAADDVVGWSFVAGEGEELDGEVGGPGAQDEVPFVEIDEAKDESGSGADGV